MQTAPLMTALSVGRILVGLGMTAAPGPAGRGWIGRSAEQPDVQIMVRGLGIRDLALGAATLGTLKATGTRGTGFRTLAALGVAVDLVDAVSTVGARNTIPSKGLPTTVIASTAAAVGAWALLRP